MTNLLNNWTFIYVIHRLLCLDEIWTRQVPIVYRNYLSGKKAELSLSHGMQKTIARFHVNNFGTLPNGRPIGIHRLTHTSVRHKHVPLKEGEKAVRIRYYKGRAYHRVSWQFAFSLRWLNRQRNARNLSDFTSLEYPKFQPAETTYKLHNDPGA